MGEVVRHWSSDSYWIEGLERYGAADEWKQNNLMLILAKVTSELIRRHFVARLIAY